MPEKYYTISGAAAYKDVTYPTINNAIKKGKLHPIIANAGLKGKGLKGKDVPPVPLLTQTELDGWSKQRGTLTDEQRIDRAAKLFGGIDKMKAALAKKGK